VGVKPSLLPDFVIMVLLIGDGLDGTGFSFGVEFEGVKLFATPYFLNYAPFAGIDASTKNPLTYFLGVCCLSVDLTSSSTSASLLSNLAF